MPARKAVSKELSEYLAAIAHPQRIEIIEELQRGDAGVTELCKTIHINQSTMSQHLSILRFWKIVDFRREGRLVIYHLVQPDLAKWLIQGLELLERSDRSPRDFHQLAAAAVRLWSCKKSSLTEKGKRKNEKANPRYSRVS